MAEQEKKYYRHKYGYLSEHLLQPIELECQCFLADWQGNAPFHFKQITNHLWPKGNKAHFVWHPWAEDMLNEACYQTRLGIHGCASSGKTDWSSIWAIVNWLSAPMQTLVLVTSTNLTDARKRIWGSVTKYWDYSAIKLPGKLTDSKGIIRTDNGTGKFNDKNGIALIAGERTKERESIGRLIGLKNRRVILIGDELPELSPALITAAEGNLESNPYFQFIALGNFNSVYDPLGEFCEPVDGYKGLSQDATRWENKKGGVTLRFDGLKSPNLLAGEDIWPILTIKKIKMYQDTLKGLQFWRMLRSFPCPAGDESLIVTEADLISGESSGTVFWKVPPTPVAALDPGFTNGGDRSVLTIGDYGESIEGIWTLQKRKSIILFEDVEKMGTMPRSHQIAVQFRDKCVEAGVSPGNAALDITGAGIPFRDIVYEKWSNEVYGVAFGGKASQMPISAQDMRPSEEQYANRVSEIWYAIVEFIRYRQIKGIDQSLAKELTSRYYDTRKVGSNVRIIIESKTDMKARIGFSPDDADSFLIMLDLVRARLGAMAGTQTLGAAVKNQSWEAQVRSCEDVYSNVTYEDAGDDYLDLAYAQD